MEAHQFKIKQRKREEFSNYFPLISKNPKIEITEISFKLAKKFILEYEWLGNIGSNRYHYGLFIEDNLAGVVCYSNPIAKISFVKKLEMPENKIIYLSRGANSFWAPKWVPSKLIGKSIKMLNKDHGIRVVLAYSDPEAWEIGTIYQASNFLYLGETDSGGAKWYIINSEKLHPRTVYRRYGSRKRSILERIDKDYATIKIKPKKKYIFIIGNRKYRYEYINKLAGEIKPYPKRE